MDNDTHDLSSRLAALEARVPANATPPVLPNRRRRGRFAVPIAMAAVFGARMHALCRPFPPE